MNHYENTSAYCPDSQMSFVFVTLVNVLIYTSLVYTANLFNITLIRTKTVKDLNHPRCFYR